MEEVAHAIGLDSRIGNKFLKVWQLPSIANHEHYFLLLTSSSSKLPKYVDFISRVLCLHVCRQVLGLVAAASRKMSSISCTSVRLSTYHRLPTTGTR